MSIEQIAYRAHATATGGREGHAKSSDGAQTLVDKAHVVCPYSNATRDNIDVTLTLV